MLKKILLGAGLFGVIAILSVGAIIRTTDKVAGTSSGRGQGYNRSAPVAESAIGWTTIEGTVVSVDSLALTVKTPNGDPLWVENRPWAFALEQKFSAQVGDQIKIKGFTETGTFTAAQIQNLTNGMVVQLRDENGRPGWSGRGRGNGGG
jgi:hypothetical protein